MNVERNIKLLLLKLNRKGQNVTLIKELRYSEINDNVYSRYKLTFWRKVKKMNTKTGKMKEVNIPDTHEFSNGIELLKFMVVKSNANE
jgi:hypothetical protein